MLLTIYKTAAAVSAPLLEAWLRRRALRGKEDAARAHERRGRPLRARGSGRLVWLHAASVGESLSLLSTVERLLQDHPALEAMVTTGTVTAAKVMAARLPPRAFHQYMPVDHPAWVRGFLDHWRPDGVIWSESELWPAMLAEIRARDIPAVLLNARMSETSFRRWRWARASIRALLSAFSLCLAQNAAEARRLERLGARNVKILPNLKYAAPPPPCDGEKLAALRAAAGARPLVLWASTHRGEEEIAARLHLALKPRHPGLLSIVAPRHPERGDDLRLLFAARGLAARQRSSGELPAPGDDVYIADTLGEMGVFYSLAPLAVVGGSFVAAGGHNPIEPAQCGAAVFYGPMTHNFETVCADFESRGASLRLKDEEALHGTVSAFLENPAAFAPMAEKARAWTREQAHVIDSLMEQLSPFTAALKAGKDV